MGKPREDTEDGYNAGDPAQVGERTRQAKATEDVRVAGMRHLLASKQGRAWFRHLLSEKLFTRVGKSRPTSMFTGNSTTFYNAALKELGDLLSHEASMFSPTDFRLMEDEGNANG